MTPYRGGPRRRPVLRALLYTLGAMFLLGVIIAALIIVPGSDQSTTGR